MIRDFFVFIEIDFCGDNYPVLRNFFNQIPFFMKKLFSVMLLLAVSSQIWAQGTPCSNTFVKQMDAIGTIEPRVFRDPVNPNYFLTATTGNLTFISGVNAAGTVLWTREIKFPGDVGIIKDLIVDQMDGTLAGIVKGNNNNYMFKYDYTTFTFNWVRRYPVNYLFENIHHVGNRYVVTGEILTGQVTIFDVNRTNGLMATTFQRAGVTGEFFSTYDAPSNRVYGACRYYSGSLFHPSLFEYDPTPFIGTNTWINTYIENTAGNTCRIYPVAPIVDGGRIVQLSSGDPTGFGVYTSGPTDAFLLKTDMAGNLGWTNQIVIPGYTQLNTKKIINTATGYYLLIDSYNGSIVNYFFVVKTDKNGVVQWANRYGISGQNTVVSGVEDNGYLYLTALSQSYVPTSPFLFLKLNPSGMSDAACSYITPVNAFESAYNNTQAPKPTPTNATTYSNGTFAPTQSPMVGKERIYCSTTCPPPTILPCSTLIGSLSSGVLAFYPFGYGSLLDLSGNGNHLQNTTAAVPTMDRSSNPTCAYRFSGTDFLTPIGSSSFLDNITTSPFSISLWYQPMNTRPVGNYELLIGRGNPPLHCPDTWGEWSLGLYDCRKAVMGFDFYSHWETSTMTCNGFMSFISNGPWHHLAFVYDGTNYTIYRDGIPSSTSSGPCGPGTFNVGALMLGVDYDGDLDDIVIYNRTLSVSEINTLMSLPGSCCDGVTSTINKTITLPQQGQGNAIKVYPNPTDGMVAISSGQSTIRSISIYSSTGQKLKTYQFGAKEVSVNIKQLAAGTYFMKVTTDMGTTTEKLIKK
jgi:hypothetical protein